MVKEELIKRSPLRILEKSTHGGLGKGNLAVVAARMGVGKTAFLVHLATDVLFQDKHVIHVSFSDNTQHIVNWYEDIFKEIANRFDLDSAMSVHDNIIRNRVIMNFNQAGVHVSQIVDSLKAMIQDGHFSADVIVVDGYDFLKANVEDISIIKQFAEDMSIEIWFSASKKKESLVLNDNGIPVILEPFMDKISILILLKHKEGYVNLELIKDHDKETIKDMHLKLDPKILLISST